MKAVIYARCDQCGRPFVKQGRVHKRCCPTCKADANRTYQRIYMREWRAGLRRRKALQPAHAMTP